MLKGYAFFSTTRTSVEVGKQNKTSEKPYSGGEQVADMKILRTLATYLWLKDNFEFRLRVVTALGFLVGAKVRTC